MMRYLRIALRKLSREKLYAILNISGLALGMACCLMLGLYLWGELTYDRHHVNHERIYRVASNLKLADGNSTDLAVTGGTLGVMLKEEYPDYFKSFVRFLQISRPNPMLLRHEDQQAYWGDVYLADSNAFDVFTHEIVYGDPRTALERPRSIAISRRVAERYFGSDNPIGRTLMPDQADEPFMVTLVFEELPENSHLRYDALIAYKGGRLDVPADITQRMTRLMDLGSFQYTYMVLADGANPRDYPGMAQAFGQKYTQSTLQVSRASWTSWLEPLASIHLNSDLQYDLPTGNRFYLLAFAAVAAFILAIACINYVNLATARAAERARSVGLSKILGASRGSLVAQFLGESVVFALLATVLAVVLVEVLLSLPSVSTLFGKILTLDLVGRPMLALTIIGFGIGVGLLAGLYPALYLSSFMPLSALVGRYQPGGGARLREALVFVQFAISIGVIACTLMVGQQMRYIASKDLGFHKDNRVLLVLRGRELVQREAVILDEIRKLPGVLGVSTSNIVMGQDIPHLTGKAENNEGVMSDLSFSWMPIGDEFIPVMGMEVIKGRDFSRRLLTDIGTSYVVNEAFVHAMGWSEPLGKRVGLGGAGADPGPVIGVVRDFNYKSLRTTIEPILISRSPGGEGQKTLVINLAPGNIAGTLRTVQGLFAKLDPSHPFEYSFLDENLDKLYVSEQRLMRLTAIFAGVCILVACLGLLGLTASATEQRTREIGIRKVLGASTHTIILLLSRRVLVLVAASAVVASIVALLAMQQWLAGFAYRTSPNPLYLLLVTVAAGLIALTTIALQSWRTASADPIKALRHE